jgi:negative regulator of replication initiation
MKVIRIDNEVWGALQKRATPLADTPNSVLRRVLGLPAPSAKKANVDKYGSRKGSKEALINDKLSSKPKSMKELLQEAGLNPQKTRYNHLNQLVREGKIKKDAQGRYYV